MRIKRTLFFSLILFLIIFSISFVSANEIATNDISTNELSTASVSTDIQTDESLNEVNLNSGDNQNLDQISSNSNEESSTSNLDLEDGTSNIEEIESDECLDNNGKVPTLRASNDEPTLGAPNPADYQHVVNLNGGSGQTIIDAIVNAQPNTIIYLNGATYSGAGRVNAAQNQLINIRNVAVYGGGPNDNNMARIINTGGRYGLEFYGYSTDLYLVNSGVNRPQYYGTSGYNLENLRFENIFASTRLISVRSGSLTNVTMINCSSEQQFIEIKGSYWTQTPVPVINCSFIDCHQTYRGADDVRDGTGQLGAVFGVYMENTNFINCTSAHHGGALCIADESDWGSLTIATVLKNCSFINVTSRWFVIYIHGNFSTTEIFINTSQIVEGCKFIDCVGTGELSAGIGLSHSNVIIRDCEFTNLTGGQGSAIMVGGIDPYHEAFSGRNTVANNVTIERCNFTNCIAKEEGQEKSLSPLTYTQLKSGEQRVPGVQYYRRENGNYIPDSSGTYYVKHGDILFNVTGDAGAIFVHGNDTKILDCIFDSNQAQDGAGAAIYIVGQRTVINNSEFFNHLSDNGTVFLVGDNCSISNSVFHDNEAKYEGACIYIEGNNAKINNTSFISNNATDGGCIYIVGQNTNISNSEFINNTAENGAAVYINGHNTDIAHTLFEGNNATNGGGVYIKGSDSVLDSNTFVKNNVTNQGGAVYIEGNNTLVEYNNFTSNEAVPTRDDQETGLGGAIFVFGDNTTTISNNFTHNKARNGSAIYTDGENFRLQNDIFYENQAWSYVLLVTAVPPESLYQSSDINITVNHRGGDNIINAIHNRASPDEIHFLNVTYVKSSGETITTNDTNYVSPVDGVELSQEGTLLYQDDREDFQSIQLQVTHEDGTPIYENNDLITDIYGNTSVLLNRSGLRKGEYIVGATHIEDWNYKFIYNSTTFRILDSMDISINKTSDKDEYFQDDISKWNLTINNAGNGTDAEYVTITDFLPDIFKLTNLTFSFYNETNGEWTNGTLYLSNNTLRYGVYNISNGNWVYADAAYNESTNTWTYYVLNFNGKTYTYTAFNPNDYIGEFGEPVYSNSTNICFKEIAFNYETEEWYYETINASGQIIHYGIFNETFFTEYFGDVRYDDENDTWVYVNHTFNETGDPVDKYTWYDPKTGYWVIDYKVYPPERKVLTQKISLTIADDTSNNRTNIMLRVRDFDKNCSANVYFEANCTKSGNYTNIANVTTHDFDWNLSNNEANKTVNVVPLINKTVSNSTPYYHTEVEYNLTVMNTGNETYQEVLTLVDSLPAGLEYIDTVRIIGADQVGETIVDGQKITWKITNIPAYTNATIIVKVLVNSVEEQLNNLTIISPEGQNRTVNTTVTPVLYTDVSVNKTSDKPSYFVDDIVTWTITVTVAGNGSNATNVRLQDILPGEVEFINYTATNGTYNNETGIWTIGFMENGTSTTLTILSRAIKPKINITNVANVSCNEVEWDYTNNIDNATINLYPNINKTVNQTEFDYYEEVEYNLTVMNTGNVTYNGTLTLIDTLPEGVTFLGVVSETGLTVVSFDNTTKNLTWVVTNITANTNATIIIKARCDAIGLQNNTFTINTPDGLTKNVTVPIIVSPNVDLSVNKTSDKPSYFVDDIVTWTITVHNAANGTNATNVRLKDVLPGEVEFINYTATNGTYNNETGIWTIGFLENGTSTTLTILSRAIQSKTNITNVANVSCDEVEWDYTNNIDNATINLYPNINKTVNQTEFDYHEEVIYNLTVMNTGNVTYNGTLTLVDTLPEGVTFLGVVSETGLTVVSFDNTTKNLTWVVTNITANTNATIIIRARCDAIGLQNNTWTIYTPDGLTKNVTVPITVNPLVDVSINKTVDKALYHIGEIVTWTITVTNAWNGTNATGVSVKDILPGEVEFVNATGGTYDNNTGTWTIGFMGNGTSQTLIIKSIARINETNITNIANVTCNEKEWNYTNNIDNATIDIVDTPIYKTSDKDSVMYGDTVEFYLTVENVGEEDWDEELTLIDRLPDGLEYIRVVNETGLTVLSFDDSTQNLTWVVTGIKAKTNATITILVRALVLGDPDNPFTLLGPNLNTTVNKTIHVDPIVDVSINKTADNETYHIGDYVTWTITVTNAANGTNATGVTVKDILPTEVEFVNATGGTYDNNTGTWTIGFMGNGTSQTLVIRSIARINGTNITNIANVTCNEEEWNYTNNIDNATINIVNVPINKTSDKDSVMYGDLVEYYLTIENLANETWTKNLTLIDVLPDGLEFIRIVNRTGLTVLDFKQESQTLTWNVTDIAPKTNATITILVRALVLGDPDNPFTVTGENIHETVNKTIHVDPIVDVSINKTADRGLYHIGEIVTWTITVTNAWNGTNATGVSVKDILPGEVEFVNATGGTYDNNTGTWTIGFMGNGTSQTLIIKSIARINETNITNIANVTCNEKEWNYTNNIDNATIDIVDTPIYKTSDKDSVMYGDTVEFYLTVENVGEEDWDEELTLIDRLPDGLEYIRVVNETGLTVLSFDDSTQNLTWVVTGIKAKTNATITILVRALVLGDPDNPFTLLGPNLNTTVNKTIHVDPIVDVSINKTADNETYHIGDYVTWTITVTNAANGTNATGVTVKDILPTEVEFVNATGGTYDNNTGTWTIGFMGNGTSQTLVIRSIARINGTNITNIANVTCNEEEWNYTNNIDNATINIVNIPINKTSDKDSVMYGDLVEYYLTIENLANETWTKNLTLIDVLPDGLEFIRIVNRTGLTVLDFKQESQTLTWNVTDIAPKTNATITILVRALVLGDPDNPFTVTGENIHETVNKTIHVDPIVDVSINKTADRGLYHIGEIVTWTITVTNAWNGTNATGVSVKDILPGEVEFVNATGGTYDNNTGTWTIGFMGNGTSQTLIIKSIARINETNITNIANVTCNEKEWNYTNNIDNTTIDIVDTPIYKTSDKDSVMYGDTVEFYLTVENVGEEDWDEELTLIDRLPDGLEYIRVVNETGLTVLSFDDSTQNLTWVVTGIKAKTNATITILVRALVLGDPDNPFTLLGPNLNTTVNKTIHVDPIVDVSINKTADKEVYHINDTVTWTITVTNAANGTNATGVTVKDILPTEVEFVNATGGTYDNNTGTWTIGFMGNGTSQTLVIKSIARVNKTNITNIANVTCNEEEWNYTNNIDNATINVVEVPINKTSNRDNFKYGETVEYYLSVTNLANETWTETLTLIDELPTGLKFVEIVGYDNLVMISNDTSTQKLTFVVTNITANKTATITIKVELLVVGDPDNPLTVIGENIHKDVNKTIHVDPIVDVSINKTADKEVYHINDTVTWTITVTNAANGTNATGVTVKDILPTEVEFVNATGGTYDNNTGTWTIGFMGNGTSQTLVIKSIARVNKTNITNIANVTCNEEEWNYTNNIDNATINVVEVPINKTSNRDNFKYGETVEYYLSVTNLANETWTETLTLIDELPTGLKFVEIVGYDNLVMISNDTSTQKLTFVVTNITANKTATITIKVELLVVGDPDNPLTVIGENIHKDVNKTIHVDPIVDVSINKTADKEVYHINDTVTWTITVTNAANGTNATGVTVKDILPTEVEFVNATGGTYDNNTGTWTIGFMGNGTSQTLVIKSIARVNKTNITNIANVTCNEEEWNYTNNIDNATINVVEVPINKTSNRDNFKYGETVEYYLSVTNLANETWTETLTLIDELPTGLKFVEIVGYDNLVMISNDTSTQKLTFVVTNITANKTATITIKVELLAVGDVDNPLNVSGENIHKDVNKTIHVDPIVDVSITKTADGEIYHIGDYVTWTITVSNAANGTNATGVTVKDILPAEVEFVNATGGTYDNNTGTWTIGFMGNGTSQTLVIRSIARINETDITNIANVTCNEEEWNYTNNIDNATINIVDTPINKTVSSPVPDYHEIVEYNLTVENLANETWTQTVTLIDSLPEGVTFLGLVKVTGLTVVSFDNTTKKLTWIVKDIQAKTNATITIKARCDAIGTQTNNWTINGLNGFTKTVNATIDVIPIVDVSVTKTSNVDVYFIDDIAVWTIKVSNAVNGTNATNVVLKDLLPSEFGFINYTASKGTYDANSGEWTIGFMKNGTSEKLVITSFAKKISKQVTNIANVTCDEKEWNYSNNIANKTVKVVDIPDLRKTVNNATPFYGDYVVYNLTIKNTGNYTYKNNLTVIDSLPEGLEFVKTLGISGAKLIKEVKKGQKITWIITDIAAKSDAIIKVKVKANALGDLTNNLTIIAPRGTNKTVNCTITPVPWADLAVTKTSDHYGIDCHNSTTVIWTIKVVNNGPNEAINAIAKDILPAGLIYISDDSNGNYDSETGVWTIGNLKKGQSVRLHIKTKVDAIDTYINNPVVVSSKTYDPDKSNNRDNSSIKVISVADLKLIKDANVTNTTVGKKFSYVITVINNGPDTAINARVYDLLPKGLKLLSFEASKGSYNPKNGTWTIGDLKNGEKVTLKINVKALVTGKIINEARVESDTFDNDTSNNNDSATVVVKGGHKFRMLPTGNPLIIALLSLIAIVGVTLRRKN